MKLEEMEPEHKEALKKHLHHNDNVIDVQMVGYLDMYGDGSRSYIVYLQDTLANCFVIANFEYYVTKREWMLTDMHRLKTT